MLTSLPEQGGCLLTSQSSYAPGRGETQTTRKQKKTKWKDTQTTLKGRYLQDERRETWRTLLQRGRDFQKAAASIQARDPMRGATEGVETQPRAMETAWHFSVS